MKLNPLTITIGVISLALVVVITALLIPQQTNPAFAVAVDFVNAAGKGDDEVALAKLSPDLQDYVADTCPDGSVSACIDAYSPPEWGDFLNGVFRRAQPDGRDAWNILLLATYAEDQGFSGVCVYTRSERVADETWQITRWSGWVSCDLPDAGLSDLMQDGATHQAP